MWNNYLRKSSFDEREQSITFVGTKVMHFSCLTIRLSLAHTVWLIGIYHENKQVGSPGQTDRLSVSYKK